MPLWRAGDAVQVHHQRGSYVSHTHLSNVVLPAAVLAWAVGGSAFYGVMVFRDYDPWTTLLNLAEFSLTPGVSVLLATLVAACFIERPWCRYACPLGAASGLPGKLRPVFREDALEIS